MRILTFVVLAMLLLGCGQNLNGHFRGNTNGNAGILSNQQQQIVLDMQNQGGTLTGSWSVLNNNITGNMQGVVQGSTIPQLYFVTSQGGASCTYQGTGTISYCQVAITLNPSSSACGQQGVSATLVKEPCN